MSDDDTVEIPDLLDDQIHYLIWQLDEIITIVIGLMAGIVIGSPILGVVLGYVAMRQYRKIRDGKPRGYLFHRVRDLGFAVDKMDRYSAMQPPLVDKYHS
ncbi:type IV conjugative transfer system protein TraL [Vibrio aestuarianus subsp. cardii]|uniref:type IV conjugative transfer system protein TraL n=1 Tax=Vibrio aestuarianus TaxID=28171 RepID=UPI0015594E9D|nr:type IV conjugative transfer system protein TraL [Vibrio aestuarianus]NGZ66611.1 type IV conjugative transfer system protein TraL [Vibrio aestuarianus subsp. cardii]